MAKLEDRVDTLESVLRRYIERSEKETIAFREEMSAFKDEMSAFKDEMRDDRREMNRQWGNLSNKMGTIVEDIVAPAVRPAVSKYFQVEPYLLARNLRKRMGNEEYEVDVLAISDKQVFWVEAKSSPRPEHVEEVSKKAAQFPRFFPEYQDKQMVIILAGLSFAPDVIQHASRKGVYVLAYREWDYMDILNFKEIHR
jgi:hypothetical protein